VCALCDRLAGSVLGFAFAANGVLVLALPVVRCGTGPAALQSGPLGPDAVRDAAPAYLTAGIALMWIGFDVRARVATLAAGAFLVLHAWVHAAAALAHHGSASVSDLPGLFAPRGMWPPLS
jgi:hypothetical protein